VSGASVDKVSVTLTPPPVKSQWQWWMSLTPRGAQLLALLKSKAAGGLYVGGLPAERAAFRKAGGVFVNMTASSSASMSGKTLNGADAPAGGA
jgi:hypothetical protein